MNLKELSEKLSNHYKSKIDEFDENPSEELDPGFTLKNGLDIQVANYSREKFIVNIYREQCLLELNTYSSLKEIYDNLEELDKLFMNGLISIYKENIGKKTIKHTKNPFKSTFQKNTITNVVPHPNVDYKVGYTFKEDDSVVEVTVCKIL